MAQAPIVAPICHGQPSASESRVVVRTAVTSPRHVFRGAQQRVTIGEGCTHVQRSRQPVAQQHTGNDRAAVRGEKQQQQSEFVHRCLFSPGRASIVLRHRN